MKKIIFLVSLLLLLPGCSISNVLGGRTSNFWNSVGGYIETTADSGFNILINGTNKYLNFNAVSGTSGYGFRDNSGTIEYKNSGGAWAGVGSGSGTGGTIAQLGQVGDVATDTPMTYGMVLVYNTVTQKWESSATSTIGLGGSGGGSVTSVDMSVPTGLTISGNPITDNGTLALSLTSGYEIPKTASTSNWDSSYNIVAANHTNWNTAYGWGDHTGLYDSLGSATGSVDIHKAAYNHDNFNSAYYNASSSPYTLFSLLTHNHSGLYDVYGQATGTINIHNATYNHTNYNTAYNNASTSPYTLFSLLTHNHNTLYDVLGQATGTIAIHNATYNHANYDTAYFNASNTPYGIFTTQASSTATYQQKLTVSVTGLTLSNNTISLTGGYEIPTSASSSNWSSFYYTPSGRITAGDYIDWTGNTLNVVGTLPISIGGTGLTTISSGGMLWANGANNLTVLASSTNGYVLQLNSAGQPSWVSTTTLGFSGGGSASFSGTQGQIEYFSDTNTAAGTSSLFLTPSGNFGIGTTTPDYLMVIGGTSGSNSYFTSDGGLVVKRATTTEDFAVGDDSAGDAILQLGTSGTGHWWLGLDDGDSDKFKISTSSSFASSMFTITEDGYVGIGNSAPTSMLTVGVSAGSQLLVSNTGVITAGTWNGDTVGVQYGGTGLTSATAGYTLVGSTASSLSATSSLFISPAGNVGVGTTSPTGKFEVSNGTHGMRVNIDESTTTLEFF